MHYSQKYKAMAIACLIVKLSRFKCDNGSEYISKEIEVFSENQGIQFDNTDFIRLLIM